ncbi:MAG: MarR family winged helix-turn-helix transcriptional regulator [Chloroflexi bacterium]|nr:winged helix-turn-helix transcriptional regulator [Chloroflexota bacterium]MBE3118216.1 winged helix-turn-helix transcriptional regulator [Candidatus Atribacteria bacterium]MCX6037424.1 MarR family winged helix-turn-helix transcriptional regulator [Chloroflexota bacterium]
MDESTRSSEKLRQAVDVFWETFPPLWRMIHVHIREVAVEQFNITVEQFHILRHIRRGRDSVSALAEAKDISRPAISQSVDLLVTRGLIVRSIDPQDRRHVKLDLTADGNALMDAIFGDTRQWMMKTLEPLSADEIQALTCSMESLKKIL